MDRATLAFPRKTVLLTAGRSPVCLDLVRHLRHANYRVLVADTVAWHVSAFSNAVERCFVVRSPAFEPQGFTADVRDIVHQERIDLILPIYEEGLLLVQDPALQPYVFAPDFPMLHALHNKWTFAKLQKQSGLEPPKTWALTSKSDLHRLDPTGDYVLKACYSQAGQSAHRLAPHTPLPALDIHEDHPWTAQAWIRGKHYCSYSVCEAGAVRAHVSYPVTYTVGGHDCVHFEAMAHPGIEAWVRHFVAYHKLRGHLGFDFIEDDKGRLHAIACNPRPTGGVHLFPYACGFGRTLFAAPHAGPLQPAGVRRQLPADMVTFGWRRLWARPTRWWGFWRALLTTPDVVFARGDQQPFWQQSLVGRMALRLRKARFLPHAKICLRDYQWNHRLYLRQARERDQVVQSVAQ